MCPYKSNNIFRVCFVGPRKIVVNNWAASIAGDS